MQTHETCKYIFDPSKYDKDLPVAAFDIDSTLIRPTNSMTSFCTKVDDYEYLLPLDFISSVQKTHNIVLFTNQARYSKITEDRIIRIMNELNIYHVFIAISKVTKSSCDKYRKPNIGMFQLFEQLSGGFHIDDHQVDHINLQTVPPTRSSFFVGDAGGRKTDFSDSDLEFAQKCNLPFIHVDDLLRVNNKEEDVDFPEYRRIREIFESGNIDLSGDETVVIFLCGLMGSGKSTITKYINENILNGRSAEIVSNDITGTKAKSLTLFKRLLSNGEKLIIIDNTNTTKKQRGDYLHLMSPPRAFRAYCIYLPADINTCIKRNSMRSSEKKVSLIAIRTANKHFEPPHQSEGFTKVFTL